MSLDLNGLSAVIGRMPVGLIVTWIIYVFMGVALFFYSAKTIPPAPQEAREAIPTIQAGRDIIQAGRDIILNTTPPPAPEPVNTAPEKPPAADRARERAPEKSAEQTIIVKDSPGAVVHTGTGSVTTDVKTGNATTDVEQDGELRRESSIQRLKVELTTIWEADVERVNYGNRPADASRSQPQFEGPPGVVPLKRPTSVDIQRRTGNRVAILTVFDLPEDDINIKGQSLTHLSAFRDLRVSLLQPNRPQIYTALKVAQFSILVNNQRLYSNFTTNETLVADTTKVPSELVFRLQDLRRIVMQLR